MQNQCVSVERFGAVGQRELDSQAQSQGFCAFHHAEPLIEDQPYGGREPQQSRPSGLPLPEKALGQATLGGGTPPFAPPPPPTIRLWIVSTFGEFSALNPGSIRARERVRVWDAKEPQSWK